MAPWKLPLLVIAIAVPIVGAFAAGGPGIGVSVGALAVVGLLVYAARQRPRGAIGEPPKDGISRLLVVVGSPLEDPAAIAEVARAARPVEAAEPAPEVLVLAPARIGFLDRWASDVEEARSRAQRNLVITVASLAKAGVAADARVGDEDLVQAVEDAIGGFPATEVILIAAAGDEAAGRAAAELGSRLRARFRHIPIEE
ncbi:MAG TPA: hypothetical protein VF731_09570 [Solirubrobacterales bacterium]